MFLVTWPQRSPLKPRYEAKAVSSNEAQQRPSGTHRLGEVVLLSGRVLIRRVQVVERRRINCLELQAQKIMGFIWVEGQWALGLILQEVMIGACR